MCAQVGEYERIRTVLSEADESLTAREILSLLEERGESFDSPHEIATVLGRRAQRGEVDVIRSSPYRYRISDGPRS